MSSLRNALLACLCITLTACGFTPVHKQGGISDVALEQMQILTPNTREGQQMRIALEDRMAPSGTAANPRYSLTPNLVISLQPLSIESDGTTRRYRLVGKANMVIREQASGKLVLREAVQRFSSYQISDADYSTYISGQDATRQLINEMADAMRLRIINHFATQLVNRKASS